MEDAMKKFILVILCLVLLVGCSSNSTKKTIGYVEAKEKIINEQAILLDVRTQEEYDESHINGAILLTLDTIDEDTIAEVVSDKSKPIIVYCKSGKRSSQALEILNQLGYDNVYDLGAMSNWKE
jgi:rhodanese-related sulfurtransferase